MSVYGNTEQAQGFSAKVLADFSNVLEKRGWLTEQNGPDITAWTFSPSYRKITVQITESGENSDSAIFSIYSSKDENSTEKVFTFKKDAYYSYPKVRSLLLPYLISLTNQYGDLNKPEQYFSSFAFGYYRINDNSDINPEKDKGVYFLNWKLAYDPARNISAGEVPLHIADFIDSSYSLSINPDGSEILGKLDETAFNIDIIVYGKSKAALSGNSRTRHIYGLFNTIEYYRPYLLKDKMLWNEDIYTDHMHIQYCYWEALAFRHDILISRNGKDLFFSYKIGAGPGQNSSLTATNITEEEEDNSLNDIFMSNWYGLNGHGDRRHNYYYSMTFPLRLEFTADKYLNSRIEFKYYFYYFQALMDIKAYDFLNRTVIRYGYYITENITAGAAYEFWHVKSRENDNRKSRHWNRLNLLMEIKF